MSESNSTRSNLHFILIGQRFSRLLVLSEVESRVHDRKYLCRCDCGKEIVTVGNRLKCGKTRSCGCLALEVRTKHGCARDSGVSRAYQCWLGMKSRCNDPKNKGYARYGGRGIRICQRWVVFQNFLTDMGEPLPGMSLDRINNNGNYEPENCRWADVDTQSHNKRTNILMTFSGRTQTLDRWAKELKVKSNTIVCRLRRGWTHEEALGKPIGEWHR